MVLGSGPHEGSCTAMRHPLNTPIGRFGIDTFEEGADGCVATMPIDDLVNPITGAPSLGALAVLVDHVGGLVNHARRGDDEWTVSSELVFEAAPNAADLIAAGGATPVWGCGRPLGPKTNTGVAACEFKLGDEVLGTGTVRSFYIESPRTFTESPARAADMTVRTGLAAMMNLGAAVSDGETVVLPQHSDGVLNNTIGVVHGGVAAAGLELVASAAVNAGRTDPLVTASLRVNFLRQFIAGDESRYMGTPLRVGRRSGVADARAVGDDGKVAIMARLTAYRC
jgi:uncharacterized protein (TIGR00369 family)